MRTTRRLAVGLTLAISLAASSAVTASAALAAPARSHPAAPSAARAAGTTSAAAGPAFRIRYFTSWKAAQRAARFGLMRPARTYGLRRTGRIAVGPCLSAGELKKRDVEAEYGRFTGRNLGIDQNNSGEPCGNFGVATRIGVYRVQGRRAVLWGVCNMAGEPSCQSRKIELYLVWHAHHVYYLANSHDVRRKVILGFARSLRPVR
jgi:hypothetical protein